MPADPAASCSVGAMHGGGAGGHDAAVSEIPTAAIAKLEPNRITRTLLLGVASGSTPSESNAPDFATDTRVESVGEGEYRAVPHPRWEIWGPMGGYVAALALRAAAADVAGRGRGDVLPASFSCQFLAPARFEPVNISTRVRRESARAAAVAVEMAQEGRAVLDAQVWFAAPVEAALTLEHEFPVAAAAFAGPAGLPSREELTSEPSSFPFWENFDTRPVTWVHDWDSHPGGDPTWAWWLRFRPRAEFSDPVVEACRLLLLADLPSWPSVTRGHAGTAAFNNFVAPSLDLAVQFHDLSALGEWLLIAGVSSVGHRGTIGFRSEVLTADRRLGASGSGQLLCRPQRRS